MQPIENKKRMRLLVTGTEGYLGKVIAPYLVDAGHEVVGLDTAFYTSDDLYKAEGRRVPTIHKDIRHVEASDFKGFDAVVHLAELSNDPTGQLFPDITHKINHGGSVGLAKTAKAAGVGRFIYMSSCSVYGVASQDVVDETSSVNPQTTYAECKLLSETDIGAMADDNFCPTYLRNATAFGASPRMRFDIVLNNFSGLAWTEKKIEMVSDGTPWRPMVHALDIAKAIRCSLEAPKQDVFNQKFNVGSNEQNYQVREMATIVSEVFPGCELSIGSNPSDNRSYRVNFDKVHAALPEFSCEWDAYRGVRQLRDVFTRFGLTSEQFNSPAFTRLKRLQELLHAGKIDKDLFWTPQSISVEAGAA